MVKKWFPLARKSVSTSRNKVIFRKIGFPLGFPLAEKKSPNKRILFQVDKTSVSTSRNGIFV